MFNFIEIFPFFQNSNSNYHLIHTMQVIIITKRKNGFIFIQNFLVPHLFRKLKIQCISSQQKGKQVTDLESTSVPPPIIYDASGLITIWFTRYRVEKVDWISNIFNIISCLFGVVKLIVIRHSIVLQHYAAFRII